MQKKGMLKNIKYLVCLLAVVYVCASCSKEYSCEKCVVQPTADSGIVVIAGGGNTVNGSYVEGEDLDSSNFLVLQVDVKTPGNYSIKTDTINGIVFSGDYTFTQTGTQFIKIYGTGTPAQNGQITISISAGGGTATYNITVDQSYKTCAVENSFQRQGNPGIDFTSIVGQSNASTQFHYLLSALTTGNDLSFTFFDSSKPTEGTYTIKTDPSNLKAGEVYVRYLNNTGAWVAASGDVHVFVENGNTYFSFCSVKFALGSQNFTASANVKY